MRRILYATAAMLLAGPAFAQTTQPLTQDQPANNAGDGTTATGSATNQGDLGTQSTNYGGSSSAATGGLEEGATTTVGGQGTGAGMNNAANTVQDGRNVKTGEAMKPAGEVEGMDETTLSKGPNIPAEGNQ